MAPQPPTRIVPRSPAEQLRRRNQRLRPLSDLYHRTLSLPWWAFLLVGCSVYLLANVVFAVLYMLQPGAISGAHDGSFADAFFFSVQTIATIGYGVMSPATFYCNVLVTIETMAGVIILALATGITFARISRPTARVVFADTAVISPFNGIPTLRFRLGNERRSQILEADVAVTLLRYERSAEGDRMRRFFDLALIRSHTPVFSLTFTIMHAIDPSSPLHGCTAESLREEDAELLISVTGLEEITSQTVHARHSYTPEEVRFDHRFADIFVDDDRGRAIDYARFHDTEPLRPIEEIP